MEQVHILRDLAVIFAGSLLVILVFYRLKLPALPGFIVAGILLGPNALGFVSDAKDVEGLAEVGVILLLFTIGIEFSLSRLKEMGRQILVGGFSQMGFTILATLAAGLAFLGGWRLALFLGFLIALSSTAIVLKVMTDKGEIDAPHGRLATGVLIFQDLCVVPIMLVLPFLAGKAEGGATGLLIALGKAALVVIVVIIAARTIVPRALSEILKTRSRELFLIAVILVGTLTALGTAAAGASLALGAFLAGLIVNGSDHAHQTLVRLLPIRDIFVALFFVTVGALIDPAAALSHWTLVAVLVGLIVAGKFAIWTAIVRAFRYPWTTAVIVGTGLGQIGEFSFILVQVARDGGLAGDNIYQATLAASVVTILINGVAVKITLRRVAWR